MAHVDPPDAKLEMTDLMKKLEHSYKVDEKKLIGFLRSTTKEQCKSPEDDIKALLAPFNQKPGADPDLQKLALEIYKSSGRGRPPHEKLGEAISWVERAIQNRKAFREMHPSPDEGHDKWIKTLEGVMMQFALISGRWPPPDKPPVPGMDYVSPGVIISDAQFVDQPLFQPHKKSLSKVIDETHEMMGFGPPAGQGVKKSNAHGEQSSSSSVATPTAGVAVTYFAPRDPIGPGPDASQAELAQQAAHNVLMKEVSSQRELKAESAAEQAAEQQAERETEQKPGQNTKHKFPSKTQAKRAARAQKAKEKAEAERMEKEQGRPNITVGGAMLGSFFFGIAFTLALQSVGT